MYSTSAPIGELVAISEQPHHKKKVSDVVGLCIADLVSHEEGIFLGVALISAALGVHERALCAVEP